MEYKFSEQNRTNNKKVRMNVMGFGLGKQDRNGGDSSEWMG